MTLCGNSQLKLPVILMFHKLLLYLERLAYTPGSPSEQDEVALNLQPVSGHFNSTKIQMNSAKVNCSTALQLRTDSLGLRASDTKFANVAS